MRRIVFAFSFFGLTFLAPLVFAQAPPGFVAVSGSRLLDGGVPLASGKITAQFFAGGLPFSASLGGGGQATTSQITARVAGGAFSFFLPDTYLTTPQNACLRVTVTDAAGHILSTFPCVQPSSAPTGPATTWCSTAAGVTSCNFDLYTQPLPALAMVTSGPQGRQGPAGPAGPAGSGIASQYLDPNGNLNLPSTASANLSGPVTFHGTNFGNGSYSTLPCDYFSATAYTGQVQIYPTCHSLNALFLEPGWSSTSSSADASPNVPRWMVPSAHQISLRSYTTGITNGFGVSAQKLAGGDFNPVNFNNGVKQASTNGADEAAVFLRNQNVEIAVPMAGVAVGATSGATLLPVNCTSACGNLGPQHPLIDTSPAKVVTATMAGYAAQVNGPVNYARLTFPGSPFTPSNCAVLTAAATTPQQKITGKTPVTLTLGSAAGLTFSGFAAGQTVVMGGPAFWESAVVGPNPGAFAGGAQTVSAALSYPHDAGGTVCTGGLAGWYAEQATFTALAGGTKYMFYVLATPTASTALVAVNGPGYFTNGVFFPGVYNFYPGATVTDAGGLLPLINRDARTGQITGIGTGTVTVGLDVNTMQIAAGDPLLNASLAGAKYLNQSSMLTVVNPFAIVSGIDHRVAAPSVFGQSTFTGYADYPPAALANTVLVPGPLLRGLSTTGGGYASAVFLQEYPVGGVEVGNHYPACYLCLFGSNGPVREGDIFGDYRMNHRLHYNPNTGDLDASSMSKAELPGATTLGGKNPCLADGTNCPQTAGPQGAQGPAGPQGPQGPSAPSIANIQIALPTAAIPANTCNPAAGSPPLSVAMQGVAATSTFAPTFATDSSSVPGWGVNGGLNPVYWPTANTFNLRVCNVTAATITPGAITLNVSAR